MGIFGGFSEFPVKFQLMVGLIENFLKMGESVFLEMVELIFVVKKSLAMPLRVPSKPRGS